MGEYTKMKKWFAKENRKDFYLLYTLAFAAISAFLFLYFYFNEKSLIWSHDGVPQHLNSLAYYGRYLREILHTIFVEHKLEIPSWDMHIGYGSDILTTLHYYVIGDPLTLLSVFVPIEKTEILYELLIFLRIYLAGISFSLYCFYHKNPKQATFMGTLIYVFAGWTIYASMKHPYFSNPMIYLPLILMGIDKIYKKEKPHLFIWATAIGAMSNFYFFYMLCIFMFIYAAFRYFEIFSKRSVKDVFRWFWKFVGYFAVALMIASVIFLPVIMTIFGTDRFQAANYVPFLYDRIYYEKYLGCLIGENMIQWGVAGYSAVAMAGVFVIFSKKKYPYLKAGFIMLNFFLLFPFAGHVLNGFSYVSNRWIWAYGMMIAYIFVKAYPELFNLSLKEKRRIFIMLLIYCGLALYASAARTQRNIMAVMILTFAVFTVISYGNIFVKGKYLCLIFSSLLVVSIMLNISYQYSYEKDYLSEFSDQGVAIKELESGVDLAELNALEEKDEVYRYDQYGAQSIENTSMMMRTNSTTYYFSVANGNISEFFDEMYLNTPWEQHYENLDGRTILDRLASVKYFVIKNGHYEYLPYGVKDQKGESEKGEKTYRAFEMKDPLPLGYTYNSYIPRQEYENMSVTEKQQAILQGIVLEESSLPATEVDFSDQKVSSTLKANSGCYVQDGKIIVTEENAKATIHYKGMDDCETYLIAENLNYDALSPKERVDRQEWEEMSVYEQNRLLNEDRNWRYWKESREATFKVACGPVEKKMKIFTDKYNAYSGKHNFLCNLGYRKDGLSEMVLTFKNTGVYTYDDLRVVCQPMGKVEKNTKNLKKEILTDVKMGINEMQGRISLSQNKALLLSIPYSKGFTAYVDGEKTEIKKANTMYMALELPKGEHEIRLVYKTPYSFTGTLLSFLGILIFVVLCIKRKYNNL